MVPDHRHVNLAAQTGRRLLPFSFQMPIAFPEVRRGSDFRADLGFACSLSS